MAKKYFMVKGKRTHSCWQYSLILSVWWAWGIKSVRQTQKLSVKFVILICCCAVVAQSVHSQENCRLPAVTITGSVDIAIVQPADRFPYFLTYVLTERTALWEILALLETTCCQQATEGGVYQPRCLGGRWLWALRRGADSIHTTGLCIDSTQRNTRPLSIIIFKLIWQTNKQTKNIFPAKWPKIFLFQIRGKDLVGAVKVMPMGLDAAIKKRTSGEFKMEVKQQRDTNSLNANFFV